MFNEEEFKKMIVACVFDALQMYTPQFVNVAQVEPSTEKRYIHSIKGLAQFLNCSVVTAQHLKNKGLVPSMQVGRKVMFDEDAVLAAMQSVKPFKNGKK